jgi:hypothetical protein
MMDPKVEAGRLGGGSRRVSIVGALERGGFELRAKLDSDGVPTSGELSGCGASRALRVAGHRGRMGGAWAEIEVVGLSL